VNGVTLIAVGILSGLYTCSWGAFKDGPWEGFNGRTFPRSVIFSLLAVELLWLWPATRNHLWLLSPFQLFFLVMGIERTWSEIFKWSFRAPRSDADRFAIPQQLTFFGKPVKAWLRGLVGAVLTVALVAGLGTRMRVESGQMWLLCGFCTGLGVSMGGAYKDAPFEGFQPFKFFRSSLVLAAISPLLWMHGPLPLGFAVFVLVGIERLLVEYYKSFVLESVPGKFRPDLEPELPFMQRRRRFHLLASAIAAIAAGLYSTGPR
jgi:hypothetical protein